MRWLIARSKALIVDVGELGTVALTLCVHDFKDVDAFDALNDCDVKILSKVYKNDKNWLSTFHKV